MLRNKLFNQIVIVANYIDDLKSNQFYNKASNIAIDNYQTFFLFLEKNFNQLDESNYLSLYLQINEKIIPNLRYIERSSTNNVPWSLISNLDKILKIEFGDNYYLLYRPQWKFNYSVFTNDLIGSLKGKLEPLFPSMVKDIDESFNSDKIHIFSFPILEKSNVLLNSIIGHEIGHFYHNNWLISTEAKDIFIKQNNELSKYYKKLFPSDLYKPYEYTFNGMQIINGMYREILSDIYGYFIFGPSMIFSLYYISSLETSFHTPSSDNNFYPVSKYRIRILYNYFLKDDESINKLKKNNSEFANNLNKYLVEIENFLEDEDYLNELVSCKKEIELFENTLPEIIDYFNKNIKYQKFNPKSPEELFKKLDKHYPINEIHNQPVSIATIIFVGWIYHYKIDSELSINEYADNNRILMKLLMKSLFSTFVHQEYNNKIL